MTRRKTLVIPVAPKPAVGTRISSPRFYGGDGVQHGTITAVEAGYLTVKWDSGRTNVMPAQVVAAPGWRIAA